jgi:DNA-binding transcriptional regulator YiaG
MTNKKETYTFSGFGFDILFHDVEVKEIHGETYPDINMNEIKLLTAKELLTNKNKLTGKKLKFLRTFLKLSYQRLSDIIDVPASTLRMWEEKGSEVTGLTVPQERQFRVHGIESLLDLEKRHMEKQIIMTESFDSPLLDAPLDLALRRDYSFLGDV